MRRIVLLLPAVLLALLFACGEDEPAAPTEDPGPIVGILELPISLRNREAAPAGAVRIEISPNALRVDGHTVVELDHGSVPSSARSGEVIGSVRDAVRSGAARRAATIDLHVNTPYETTALTIGTLAEAGIGEIAFKVRKPGGSSDTGFLVLSHFRVQAHTDDPVELTGAAQRTWPEMVAAWEEGYEGCRRDHYVDCTPAPVVAAEGGKLEIRFFARGSALKADFRRFGVEEEPAQQAAPQMLEGIRAPVPNEGEEIIIPVDHGAFTWRFEGATDELSPISAAFRPLCGARACGVIVTGDKETLSMRLISMLGAAFPDGATAPEVVFLVPTP